MIDGKFAFVFVAALVLSAACRGTSSTVVAPATTPSASAQPTLRVATSSAAAGDGASTPTELAETPTTAVAPTQTEDQRLLDDTCTQLTAVRSCACVTRVLVEHFGTLEHAATVVRASTTAAVLAMVPELRACFGD